MVIMGISMNVKSSYISLGVGSLTCNFEDIYKKNVLWSFSFIKYPYF